MTAKEYLEQLRWIDREIESKEGEIEVLRARAEGRSSPRITDMPRSGGGTDNTDVIIRMAELEKYISEQKRRLIDLKRRVTRQIYGLKDPRSRVILSCRYLQKQKWEEIEKHLAYEHSSMMKLHKKALKEFELAYPSIKRIKNCGRTKGYKNPH